MTADDFEQRVTRAFARIRLHLERLERCIARARTDPYGSFESDDAPTPSRWSPDPGTADDR